MKLPFNHRIRNDLKESLIDWKVIIAFIPIAFGTYMFHEFGHWTLGELTGNDMTAGLNYATPRNGNFLHGPDALWSAIGGPLFTILQGLIFLLVTWLTKSIYAYSAAFFAVFSRFFSIFFGDFHLQDESGIASLLGVYKYSIAALVLIILSLILWRCCRIMKLNVKAVAYFAVLGVLAILMVLAVNNFILRK
ncbi:MAG TPA: hypothetical protein VMT63_03060 [Bacteroidales bacterium]|nr:hypothetical protein [Bacteroidales bacterium]